MTDEEFLRLGESIRLTFIVKQPVPCDEWAAFANEALRARMSEATKQREIERLNRLVNQQGADAAALGLRVGVVIADLDAWTTAVGKIVDTRSATPWKALAALRAALTTAAKEDSP